MSNHGEYTVQHTEMNTGRPGYTREITGAGALPPPCSLTNVVVSKPTSVLMEGMWVIGLDKGSSWVQDH